MIRSALKSDMPQLWELMKAFAEFDGSADNLTVSAEDLEQAFFAKDPKIFCLVVERNEKIVGFLNYFLTISSFSMNPCLWVEDIFISQDYRSKGIGAMLFEEIRKIADARSCHKVEWLVRANNESGIQFYKKLGAKVYDDTNYVTWDMT